MDGDTLSQLNQITRELRKIIYSIKKPEFMLFDIDTILFGTYGNQEGEGFNYHYKHGYHPLLCYDGLTGDLLKADFFVEIVGLHLRNSMKFLRIKTANMPSG